MTKRATIIFCLFLLFNHFAAFGQHSVARQWNEIQLDAIRNDFARPTVHARNLFHSSVMMYDAWAAYDDQADTYLLGNSFRGFEVPFLGVDTPEDIQAAREEAISYAMYRLLIHRFEFAPGVDIIYEEVDSLMNLLGYDPNYTNTDYTNGNPAALGNYIAEQMIAYGQQDGSNEAFDYLSFFYLPVNPPLVTNEPGNPNILDYNRWQPLTLDEFIDQAGNPQPFDTPEFVSPEWGWVVPFSLQEEDATFFDRDNAAYLVYHDPGPPPYLDTANISTDSEQFKWGFSLVSIWGAHLDPADSVYWDISPASIGNIPVIPDSAGQYPDFYDLFEGGDPSLGRPMNPITGQPYPPQIVPRADYGRVLAEFWADGPDSETPPGHWFTILNYVNDHPMLEKRFKGEGPVLDDLEWDVKSYLIMGGAMHDCAISAWGIKGYYDYIRPISAIRAMADLGQSSDENLPNYHKGGIPLYEGYIELVTQEDIDNGDFTQADLHKIKLYSWRGPDYINDPETDLAGVGWILAENWWPYQRPSFVAPPFAGYVSGHSTYSRGAAEVLTLLTGDEYFPGGVGEFFAPKNEFLVFEEGPSVDLTLQWATYRDASDQTSLSRIWGGIHPPADDIPGRRIGEVVGIEAFNYAEQYFNLDVVSTEDVPSEDQFVAAFPNPVQYNLYLSAEGGREVAYVLYNQLGQPVQSKERIFISKGRSIDMTNLPGGIYWLEVRDLQRNARQTVKVVKY